ncbi:MAG: hypothetical protein D6714_17760 [Bacteroidetes bacterium]|nr:MAG: hypothetical protein D6714_17760 [Bacteroidota bacterium]
MPDPDPDVHRKIKIPGLPIFIFSEQRVFDKAHIYGALLVFQRLAPMALPEGGIFNAAMPALSQNYKF